MIAALHALQGHFDFRLDIVDVDDEPELEQRYGKRVPVLADGDRELCHYVLDSPAVTAYLSKFR
jgi:glutathione S-transferase